MDKRLIAAGLVASAGLMLALPVQQAEAHGRHGRVGISVGYGYGYGGFGWPGPRYRSFAYPRTYLGVTVRPGIRSRRNERREEGEVSQKALYVYPAAGQSDEQMGEDRYECHVWSVSSTGFDPTLGAGSREEGENYGRAFTACMEGRGYVVR